MTQFVAPASVQFVGNSWVQIMGVVAAGAVWWRKRRDRLRRRERDNED